MRATIYNYLKENATSDNWGVICLDDFCKETGFKMDDVCNEIDSMPNVLADYFVESFHHQGYQMLDFEII